MVNQWDDDNLLQAFLHDTHWFNFELTNFCNIECPYCSNPHLKNKGYMSFEIFKSILDKLFKHNLSQKEVIFCGYGESFLNKNIYDMIDYATDCGVKLTIQSNGKWKLNRERIDSLFKIHRLSVTIDGVTNGVYNLSRPNTDVNLIFDNLKDIVSLRERYDKKQPIVTAKMNVFSFNKHETHAFISKCKDLNFDQINLSKGYGPQVETFLERSEFVKYADIGLNIDERLFKSEPDCTGHTRNKTAACVKKDIKAIEDRPAYLFTSLGCFNTATIKWDGTLSPCCTDIDFNIPLGNIAKNDIDEIISYDNLNVIGTKILKSKKQFVTKVPCVACAKFIEYFKPGIPAKLRRIISYISSKV